MVKILNPKQKKFTKKASKSHKKINKQRSKPKNNDKSKDDKEKIGKNSGRLPVFDKSSVIIKFNEKTIKELVSQIYQKNLEKSQKQELIKNVIGIISQHNAKFICKKWALKGIESCLKYADSINKNVIFPLIIDNAERISVCPSTDRLIYKLIKYTLGTNRRLVFIAFIDKILNLFYIKNSVIIANKIFLLLNTFQRKLLMLRLFKISGSEFGTDRNCLDNRISENNRMNEISVRGDKNEISLNNTSNTQSKQLLKFNTKLDTKVNNVSLDYSNIILNNNIIIKQVLKNHNIYNIVENLITVSQKSEIIGSNFFCYIINFTLNIFDLEKQLILLNLFNLNDIEILFNYKDGIYIISKFLRACASKTYVGVINFLTKYTTDELLSDEMLIFYISAVYKPENLEIFENYIFNKFLENFDLSMRKTVFIRLISYILEPGAKKILAPFLTDFITECDLLSNTPASFLLYSRLQPKIYEKLFAHAHNEIRACLTCQYRANVILQLAENAHKNTPTASDNVRRLYTTIAECVTRETDNNNLLFCHRQVCWFLIKLIHDDFSRNSEFIDIFIQCLDEKIVKVMKDNQNTSLIFKLLKEKAPEKHTNNSLLA